jgi:type II secretion system protein N
MSRSRLGIWAGLAAVVFFAAGVAATFPGESVARYVGQQMEAGLGIPVSLTPVRVTWRGLAADRLEIRAPGAVLAAQNLRIAWGWGWFSGLPVDARIGTDGTVEAVWSWNGGLAVNVNSVQLQDLPLRLPGDAKITGRISLNARLEPPQQGRPPGELPQGQVDMRAEGIEIGGVKLVGAAMPPLRLELVEGRGTLGPIVRIETLTFRGDAEGSVTGTVAVNPARFGDSRLQLNVTLALLRPWINQLGDLRPLAEGFLPGGRLEGTVEGTVAAPTFTRTGKRG